MIMQFVEGLGLVIALGFALTMLVVAWTVPVAVVFGIITITQKGAADDRA